jgi:hypothetical protein
MKEHIGLFFEQLEIIQVEIPQLSVIHEFL